MDSAPNEDDDDDDNNNNVTFINIILMLSLNIINEKLIFFI